MIRPCSRVAGHNGAAPTHHLCDASLARWLKLLWVKRKKCSQEFQALASAMSDGDALKQENVKVCDACCCCYNGFLLTDGCFGCMSSETMCCYECEFCCKSGAPTLMCGCLACRLVSPTVCIKTQAQCCCLVGATALPPDDEVPCMISLCGINCKPAFGCLQTIGTLFPDKAGGAGGSTIGNSDS